MPISQIPFISSNQIDAICSYKQIVEIQRDVFIAFANKEAVMGPRAILTQEENAQLSYIARASKAGPTIVKFGSVTPSNLKRHLPVVQTTIALLDAIDGSVKYFLDGECVTRWRTVAASLAAALTLANPPKKIGVIGLGHQGIAHINGVKEIFPSVEILGFVRSEREIPLDVEVTSNFNRIQECDLLFVCTNSIDPVITDPLTLGTTCISIGSFAPNRLEVAPFVLTQADKVFGDDAKTISEQSGSVVSALKESNRKWENPISIGEVYSEKIEGRTNKEEVIYYFSVGLGIQDAAMAEFILKESSK